MQLKLTLVVFLLAIFAAGRSQPVGVTGSMSNVFGNAAGMVRNGMSMNVPGVIENARRIAENGIGMGVSAIQGSMG